MSYEGMRLVYRDGVSETSVTIKSPLTIEMAQKLTGETLPERQIALLSRENLEHESEDSEDIDALTAYIKEANRTFADIFGFPTFSGQTTIKSAFRVMAPIYCMNIIPQYTFDDIVNKILESRLEESQETARCFVEYLLSEYVIEGNDIDGFYLGVQNHPFYGAFRKITVDGETIYEPIDVMGLADGYDD